MRASELARYFFFLNYYRGRKTGEEKKIDNEQEVTNAKKKTREEGILLRCDFGQEQERKQKRRK